MQTVHQRVLRENVVQALETAGEQMKNSSGYFVAVLGQHAIDAITVALDAQHVTARIPEERHVFEQL